jgi:hypothetical protein
MRAIATVDERFASYNIEMAGIVGGRFYAPYPAAGAEAATTNTRRSEDKGLPAVSLVAGAGFEPAAFRL